ncbi:hypothetical protein NG895_15715 [Aeoliella sp. ICT_H6.2]|uniref:Right handed beta helix domain-containing protein n=1 Tax=Aeoliella straminimaris TaxID=2954799 RepID=A0A9X2JJT1_9BACT|nr:hypothetical protein [Aeoliella straminimaris]MCO6045359.1 hypothetical protein [Aeoliella straminimaris]
MFLTDPSSNFISTGAGASYFYVIGLDLSPNNRAADGSDGGQGVKITGTGSDILIEDCRLEGYFGSITVQGYGGEGNEVVNVYLRRNAILNSWGNSPITGFFSNYSTDVVIEENFFDHNGWHPTKDNPDIFSHNIYLSNEVHSSTVVGNIFSRGSSMGTKFKVDSGTHIVKDNLYVRNPAQAQYGDGPDDVIEGSIFQIEDNVYLEGGSSEGFTNSDGLGVSISDIEGGYFKNNIIANRVNAQKIPYALSINTDNEGAGVNNFEVDSNVIYRWGGPVVFQRVPQLSAMTFSNNTLVDPNGVKHMLHPLPAGDDSYSLSNNQYYSTASDSGGWFKELGQTEVTTADYLANYEPTANFEKPSFIDPTRTSLSYAAKLGFTNYEQLVGAWAGQSQGTWNADLTAHALNEYIREGFQADEVGLTPLPAPSEPSSSSFVPTPSFAPSATWKSFVDSATVYTVSHPEITSSVQSQVEQSEVVQSQGEPMEEDEVSYLQLDDEVSEIEDLPEASLLNTQTSTQQQQQVDIQALDQVMAGLEESLLR